MSAESAKKGASIKTAQKQKAVKPKAVKPKAVSAEPAALALYGRVRDILQAARNQAARSVNTAQVVANWLIGREIVEDEQQGQHRAGYGAKLLAGLSMQLSEDFGRGYSVDNLEAFRQFYVDYPRLISETVSRKWGVAGLQHFCQPLSAPFAHRGRVAAGVAAEPSKASRKKTKGET